jgi:hypothetical protein
LRGVRTTLRLAAVTRLSINPEGSRR